MLLSPGQSSHLALCGTYGGASSPTGANWLQEPFAASTRRSKMGGWHEDIAKLREEPWDAILSISDLQ